MTFEVKSKQMSVSQKGERDQKQEKHQEESCTTFMQFQKFTASADSNH